jgi:hypothetical protein
MEILHKTGEMGFDTGEILIYVGMNYSKVAYPEMRHLPQEYFFRSIINGIG